MIEKVPKRCLVTGARAPAALQIARNLHGAGHAVVLADHVKHPLAAASKMHQGYCCIPSFRLDPEGARAALNDAIARYGIEHVIPTCEEVFYLAQIWESHPMPARLIAPGTELLYKAHNKFAFIQLCRDIGLDAPTTHLLTCSADLVGFSTTAEDLVFKPVWSRFASRVLLRPKPENLNGIVPTAEQPWVAQRFIPGEEVSVYAMAHDGKLTALSAYRGLIRAGLGASVCFAPVSDQAVRRFVERFVSETGWSGQVSFDLIRDQTGRLWPLECNPRATSGVHFFFHRSDFAQALLSPHIAAEPDIHAAQGVRLALWIYGAAALFRKGGLRQLVHAARHVEDVLHYPKDPIRLTAQMRSVLEFAGIALKRRVSLHTASTFDLEWDGPDQSSIS